MLAGRPTTCDDSYMGKPAIEIEQLSKDERLRLLDALWESLRQTPDEVPLLPGQREELDRSLDELDQEGPSGIPWDDVVRNIKDRSPSFPVVP